MEVSSGSNLVNHTRFRSTSVTTPNPFSPIVLSDSFEAMMAGTSAQNHTAAKFSGYPSPVLIRKVPSNLTCLLCTKGLKDPHLTTCCRQHYCLPCLRKWCARTEKPTCPNCRSVEPKFSRVHDLRIDRSMKQSQVQCKCCEKCKGGGNTKLQFKTNCCHCQRRCPNMCGETVYHQDLCLHLSDKCMLRKHCCKYCGLESTYRDITTNHYDVCGDFPLKCPNNCDESRLMKRSLLGKHLGQCPLQQVDCEFQVIGCQSKILHVDQKQHNATHVQSHTELLLESLQNSIQAVRQETEFLSTHSRTTEELKSLPLECLKTITGAYESRLEVGSPPLTLRMNNYSSFKQKGSQYWHSLTFSIKSCKMFIAVAANGIKDGEGSHVSVLLKVCHHVHDSCWRDKQLIIEALPQQEDALVDKSLCVVEGSKIFWNTLETENTCSSPVTLFMCPKFMAHADVECGMLLQDSLVFRLRLLYNVI